jgi:hypothetical protein
VRLTLACPLTLAAFAQDSGTITGNLGYLRLPGVRRYHPGQAQIRLEAALGDHRTLSVGAAAVAEGNGLQGRSCMTLKSRTTAAHWAKSLSELLGPSVHPGPHERNVASVRRSPVKEIVSASAETSHAATKRAAIEEQRRPNRGVLSGRAVATCSTSLV